LLELFKISEDSHLEEKAGLGSRAAVAGAGAVWPGDVKGGVAGAGAVAGESGAKAEAPP